jgi:2-methylisocitrate lyase-like PEP mutase family enzyme
MSAFSDLHVPGRPLFLPNAWDVASGAALARAGFPAIGTTSLGVAAASGRPDAQGATRTETVELARRLGGGLRCLLTVDIEGGFSDDPAEVAQLCAELAAAGAVGVNLEDGLGDPDRLVATVRAVKARVPDLFVNARTDTFWLSDSPSWTDTVDRVRAYHEAGADGIFVPGLVRPEYVRELTSDVRLNLLYQPDGPGLAELADLGVARVSTGSWLFRVALGAALEAARGRAVTTAVPSYAEVQAFTNPPQWAN